MASSSRALMVVAFLLAAAAVAFLLVGNPFAPKAGDADRPLVPGEDAPAAATLDGRDGAPRASAEDPALLARFESVGQGGVTVRLISFKDRKPLAGQVVRMASARGEKAERPTGEDGRVLFAGLSAAKDWTLSVEGRGFSPVEMKGVAVRARGVTDLGDLLLGDKVVLKGRVIDGRGKPLPGTSVSAYIAGGYDASLGMALALSSTMFASPAPTDETTTDDAGLFTLASLAPGTPYELKATHPGYAFSVQAGLVVSPDRSGGVLTIVLGPAATARGRVSDEKGAPVANATVVAVEGGFGRMSPSIKKDFTRTRADGTYVIDTLTRGQSYRFAVSAEGYAPVVDGMGPGVSTETGEVVRDFTLVKGGAIEGVVTDKTTGKPVAGAKVIAVTGQIRFGGGRRGGPGQAPGAGSSPADESLSTQTAVTGDEGTFRIEGLKPGPVSYAQVKASGYADFAAMSFPGSANASWGEVAAGEPLKVTVQLTPGGSVTGRVMAAMPSGTVPLPGSQVAVIAMSFQTAMTGYPTAVSGDDGSYRIDGIPPGTRFGVVVTASGYVSPNVMDPANQTTMPEGGGVVTRDVTVTTAGAVEGTVTDSKGVPVSGARVHARSLPQGGRGGFGMGMMRQIMQGGASVVLTDDQGRYRLDSVASDERTVVDAEAEPYVPGESEPFQVQAGEVKRADVVLQGGGTLKGRVIDDRGAAVADARVRTGHLDAEADANPNLAGWRADGLLDSRVSFSDAEGWFEVTRIPAGRTLVKVEKEGYSVFYRRDLTVQSDETVDNFVVTLVRGQPIAGVVKGEDGKPVANAWVAVTRQENPQRGFGGGQAGTSSAPAGDGTVEPALGDRTDDQGRFEVENVAPGPSYTVVVWFAQGYQGYGQGADSGIRRGVAAGTKDVEFVLKKAPEGSPQGFPPPPVRVPGTGLQPGMGGPGGRVTYPPPAPPGMGR